MDERRTGAGGVCRPRVLSPDPPRALNLPCGMIRRVMSAAAPAQFTFDFDAVIEAVGGDDAFAKEILVRPCTPCPGIWRRILTRTPCAG